MINNAFRLFFIFVFLTIFLALPGDVFAAKLFFDPQYYTASPPASFNVRIRIDTQGVKSTSANARIPFDGSLIEVVSVAAGDFYPQSFKNVTDNLILVGGAVQDASDTRTGTGILSTLTLRGKTTGSTQLKFDCTQGSKRDSNITQNDNDASDALSCSQLVAGTYTFSTSSSQPNPTTAPLPTSAVAATKTPTPTLTELPVTAEVKPTLLLLSTALAILAAATALIL